MNKRIGFREFLKNIRRSDGGQSLVEVAVTLPLLLLLMIGGVEFACLAYAAIEVSNSAKAAVQYGAQTPTYVGDTGGMQNAVNAEVTDVPGLTGATLTNATTTLVCSDGTVPSDGNTGGPYSNMDCTGSHAVQTLAVKTQATFTPWAIVNPLLKVTNLPTSFTLTGYATQVVVN